jgi:hypothetical protein
VALDGGSDFRVEEGFGDAVQLLPAAAVSVEKPVRGLEEGLVSCLGCSGEGVVDAKRGLEPTVSAARRESRSSSEGSPA